MTLTPVVVTVAKKSKSKTRARGVRNREATMKMTKVIHARVPAEFDDALETLPTEYVGGRALDKSSHIRIAIQNYLIQKGALKK